MPCAVVFTRVFANRIPWQLGDTLGSAEVRVSDRIAWQVERHFGSYGEMTGNVFRTDYSIPRLLISCPLRILFDEGSPFGRYCHCSSRFGIDLHCRTGSKRANALGV